jgi:hypothetical protein
MIDVETTHQSTKRFKILRQLPVRSIATSGVTTHTRDLRSLLAGELEFDLTVWAPNPFPLRVP